MDTVRIGILGAARIAPAAVIKPARERPKRSRRGRGPRPRRADAFAAKHGIPKVHDSYAALLADPDIDAIYNPLPNGLHAEWTIAALEAGKHVLCEKPFTANTKEAEQVAAVADAHRPRRDGGVPLPLPPARAPHARDRRERRARHAPHVEAALCFPLPKFSDIRYQYDLAGGATMDVGTYTVHMARLLGLRRTRGALGHGQAAHARRRSRHARRAAVPERAHRPDHLLDVVDGSSRPRPRHRRPRRAARDQPDARSSGTACG